MSVGAYFYLSFLGCGFLMHLSNRSDSPRFRALYFLPLVPTFGTRPRHQTRAPCLGPPRLKKGKSNFFINCNILHTLKNEPLNIMLLHTSRRMNGPWIKTVPVVSRIFDVSPSTGLGIEGCRTCWKDELGNHTIGTKAQNMHQLRVFGVK